MLKWFVEHYVATGVIVCGAAGSIATFATIHYHLHALVVALAAVFGVTLGTPIVLTCMTPFLHQRYGVDPMGWYDPSRIKTPPPTEEEV